MIKQFLRWLFRDRSPGLPPPCRTLDRDPFSKQDSYFKILDRLR